MATIATFGNGSYNPSYVSRSVNNGVTTEIWNKFTVVKDSFGTITWNDIAGNYPEGNEPRKFNVTQTTSQPSITYGNGDSVNITNKNGWYLHSFAGNNNYLGYSIITIVPSTGGGTSTEGVATVQWSASFSKNPGDDYWRWTVTGLNTDSTDYIYLYDEMPTSISTHQPIGTRTFTSSSSSSTQYGLFIPDITKTYYVINFLSGGSFEILATKNFAAKKKVFCNFW
jgi:hypothetical protein